MSQNVRGSNSNDDVDADSLVSSSPQAGIPIGKPPSTEPAIFGFDDMHLVVGDWLQVECPAPSGIGRVFVRVVGYVEGISLIVTASSKNGKRLNILENEILTIRVFSRQRAFAFRSSVLRACQVPLDYLHLSFPEVVHGRMIRKSTRVRIELAVTAFVPAEGQGEGESALIENMSSTGALLVASKALGATGDALRLDFEATLHDVDTPLSVEALLLNVVRSDDLNREGTEEMFRHGMEFRNLKASDRMIIKSLVYQQIIENPNSIV